jgi:hypothetical protein
MSSTEAIGRAYEARYVLAGARKLTEVRLVLVMRADGTGVLYEGTPEANGPVIDGPAGLVRKYAGDRHADFTAKGYVPLMPGMLAAARNTAG